MFFRSAHLISLMWERWWCIDKASDFGTVRHLPTLSLMDKRPLGSRIRTEEMHMRSNCMRFSFRWMDSRLEGLGNGIVHTQHDMCLLSFIPGSGTHCFKSESMAARVESRCIRRDFSPHVMESGRHFDTHKKPRQSHHHHHACRRHHRFEEPSHPEVTLRYPLNFFSTS